MISQSNNRRCPMNSIFSSSPLPKAFASGLVCLTVLVGLAQGQSAAKAQRARPGTQSSQTDQPARLEFREFLEPEATGLKPSAKLSALNGKRVRMVGFMAQLETP